MEFAPGLLSTTIDWPSASESFCVTTRVTLSVMPPGVYGTIHRMGFAGYWAAPQAGANRMQMQARRTMRRSSMDPPGELAESLHCAHGPQLFRRGTRLPGDGARLAARQPPEGPEREGRRARPSLEGRPVALAPHPRAKRLDRPVVAQGVGRHGLGPGAALHLRGGIGLRRRAAVDPVRP